jgi:hypothetical protein
MTEEYISLGAKCKVCGKTRGLHQNKTAMCPTGLKTRIGYTSFGPTVFELKPSSEKEIEAEKKRFKI